MFAWALGSILTARSRICSEQFGETEPAGPGEGGRLRDGLEDVIAERGAFQQRGQAGARLGGGDGGGGGPVLPVEAGGERDVPEAPQAEEIAGLGPFLLRVRDGDRADAHVDQLDDAVDVHVHRGDGVGRALGHRGDFVLECLLLRQRGGGGDDRLAAQQGVEVAGSADAHAHQTIVVRRIDVDRHLRRDVGQQAPESGSAARRPPCRRPPGWRTWPRVSVADRCRRRRSRSRWGAAT